MSDPTIVTDMEKAGDFQNEVDQGVGTSSAIDPAAERRLLRKIDLHVVVGEGTTLYLPERCAVWAKLTKEAHRVAHVFILESRP
jgi:hypothetical protein